MDDAIGTLSTSLLDGTWPRVLVALLVIGLVIGLVFGLFPIGAVTLIERLYPKGSDRRGTVRRPGELYTHIHEAVEKNPWTAPIVVFHILGLALREAPRARSLDRKRRVDAEDWRNVLKVRDAGVGQLPLRSGSATYRVGRGRRKVRGRDAGSIWTFEMLRNGDKRRLIFTVGKRPFLECDDRRPRVSIHFPATPGKVRIEWKVINYRPYFTVTDATGVREFHLASDGRRPRWKTTEPQETGLVVPRKAARAKRS